MSTTAVTASRRRGPWRWLVALLATVLLVVSGSGLVAFAQSGSGATRGPAFVPADAPIYVVGRLDMPGGQSEALAQFLTAFPGFADAGSFNLKKNELADGLVSQITNGAMTYSGELETFLTGEVGLAILNLTGAAMSGGNPPLLLGLAISDAAKAQSFVDLLTANATAATTEQYGSTSVISDDQMAIAVTDQWILVGQSADDVKAGIDVVDGTTPGLSDSADFTTAFARVPSAYLAAAYVNLASFGSLIETAGAAAGAQSGMTLNTADLLAMLPKDMTAYLAASPDRLSLEAFITPSPGTPQVPMGESNLATKFPSDTQVYIETRELGTTLENALTGLLGMLDEQQTAQIAPIESMLGEPLPKFFDFVSDASLGASVSSDGLWVGLAAEVTDEATAAARVERLMSIVRLLSAQADSGVTIEDSTVGNTTVTTVTLPMSDVAGNAGLPVNIGNTVSVAISDGTLLFGTGDFVTNALTQGEVDSLALSPGYADALGDNTTNAGVTYVNVSALLTELDPLLAMMSPQWENIKPYATGIDRIVAVGNSSDVISSKIEIIANS